MIGKLSLAGHWRRTGAPGVEVNTTETGRPLVGTRWRATVLTPGTVWVVESPSTDGAVVALHGAGGIQRVCRTDQFHARYETADVSGGCSDAVLRTAGINRARAKAVVDAWRVAGAMIADAAPPPREKTPIGFTDINGYVHLAELAADPIEGNPPELETD